VAKAVELGVDSVQDVLTTLFGLDGEVNVHEYRIHCPNPEHPDSSPSTDVNLETGYWNCFSCGVGGDLADLGKRVLKVPRRDVIEMLKPRSPEALLTAVQRKINSVALPTARGRRKPSLTLPGGYLAATSSKTAMQELCTERGFLPATLDKWGICYVKEQELVNKKGDLFTIHDSIAIPIRDSSGRLLSWCYRTTRRSPSWQPRYLYSPGTEPSEMWFGLQHNASAEHIAIAEGALDAAWVDQCGYPCLGLLGSKMGTRKIVQLMRYRTVTLFADRDAAGAQWVARIGGELGNKLPLYVVRYNKTIVNTYSTEENKGKLDPQMLAAIDVEISMEQRISWGAYKLRSAS
jgi:hypothetical protein